MVHKVAIMTWGQMQKYFLVLRAGLAFVIYAMFVPSSLVSLAQSAGIIACKTVPCVTKALGMLHIIMILMIERGNSPTLEQKRDQILDNILSSTHCSHNSHCRDVHGIVELNVLY